MNFNKRIVRNPENTKIAGVCGAIADLFGIDAKIVRISYVVLTVLTAILPGIFFYFFLMLFIPRELESEKVEEQIL